MPKTAHCHVHPKIELICPSCRPDLVIDRAAGGRANKGQKSKARAKAARLNGRLGGRPTLPKHSAKCDVKVTGRYTPNCPRCRYDEKRGAEQLLRGGRDFIREVSRMPNG